MQDTTGNQEIIIKNRSEVQIDEVNNVRALDENTVVLDTRMGKIVIEGDGLKIESLEKGVGRILISGKVSGVFYSDFKEKKKGRGLFA